MNLSSIIGRKYEANVYQVLYMNIQTVKQKSRLKPLSGKVVILTGGSKGIRRAISLHLAANGAKVVANYSSDSTAPPKEQSTK